MPTFDGEAQQLDALIGATADGQLGAGDFGVAILGDPIRAFAQLSQ